VTLLPIGGRGQTLLSEADKKLEEKTKDKIVINSLAGMTHREWDRDNARF
jgi:hypothetical protein